VDFDNRNERKVYKTKNTNIAKAIKNKKIIKLVQDIEKKGEQGLSDLLLSKDIYANLQIIKTIFKDCYDLSIREFSIQKDNVKCFIAYIDGTVNYAEINENILSALMKTDIQIQTQNNTSLNGIIQFLKQSDISITNAIEISNAKEIVEKLLNGFCLLFVDKIDISLALGVEGWEERKYGESKVEPILRGSPASFVENIKINTALIRKKIKSPELKYEMFKLGTLTQTQIVIAYINGIVDQKIVDVVRDRILNVDVDIVIESGHIQHFIEENKISIFPLAEFTERPDLSAIALSEGRVVILVDGTPFVQIVPTVFSDFFIAAEDNFIPSFFTPFIIILRYVAFFMALLFPSLFIAATTFHQEMIPFQLLTTLVASRANLPFPVFFEAVLMETTFELLREAGERLPTAIGQSLGIVGALVIGQAAIQAGIVSPAMVVVVAATGTASFVIPKQNMSRTVRMLKLPFMISAATLGIYGISIMGLAILILMVSLRSVGVPYMAPFSPSNKGDWKTMIFRLPAWLSNNRPTSIQKNNIKRTKNNV
jgi:spore germination protein KA